MGYKSPKVRLHLWPATCFVSDEPWWQSTSHFFSAQCGIVSSSGWIHYKSNNTETICQTTNLPTSILMESSSFNYINIRSNLILCQFFFNSLHSKIPSIYSRIFSSSAHFLTIDSLLHFLATHVSSNSSFSVFLLLSYITT